MAATITIAVARREARRAVTEARFLQSNERSEFGRHDTRDSPPVARREVHRAVTEARFLQSNERGEFGRHHTRDSPPVARREARRAVTEARFLQSNERSEFGGGRGIRTPDTLSGTAVFKTAAINHSAIPPVGEIEKREVGSGKQKGLIPSF